MTRQLLVCLLLVGSALARPDDPEPKPHPNLPEMAPLKRWAGTWESEWKLAQQWNFKEKATSKWVMNGFFLQTTFNLENTTLPQKTHGMTMMTYDLSEKAFRRWEFASNGARVDNLGSWDEKARTMTWVTKTSQTRTVTTEKFIDDDTIAWHMVMTNTEGKVVSEADGKKKRSKP